MLYVAELYFSKSHSIEIQNLLCNSRMMLDKKIAESPTSLTGASCTSEEHKICSVVPIRNFKYWMPCECKNVYSVKKSDQYIHLVMLLCGSFTDFQLLINQPTCFLRWLYFNINTVSGWNKCATLFSTKTLAIFGHFYILAHVETEINTKIMLSSPT